MDEVEESKLGRCDFGGDGIFPERLHKANEVCVSIITSCEAVVFRIVPRPESPSEA